MSNMENVIDISKFVEVTTEENVLTQIVNNVKARRKDWKLSQKELAERSGVSYASIRRFENNGEISFTSLLKIADALQSLNEFTTLFSKKIITDLKDYK